MRIWLGALLLISLSGCKDHILGEPIGNQQDSGSETTLSYPQEVHAVFQNNTCTNAGCHGDGSSSADVALDIDDCGTAVESGIVDPGSSSTSPLWLEVEEETMPIGASPLSQEDKDIIAAWIDSGANCDGEDADTGLK